MVGSTRVEERVKGGEVTIGLVVGAARTDARKRTRVEVEEIEMCILAWGCWLTGDL